LNYFMINSRIFSIYIDEYFSILRDSVVHVISCESLISRLYLFNQIKHEKGGASKHNYED